MHATSPRWHEVTPTEYAHERRALEYVRELLPDESPWAAWSNFTFVAADGRHREVDLLVATPRGLHLIEIKNWRGRLSNDGPHWTRGGRPTKSPLDLTVKKSKELCAFLEDEARRVDTAMRVPFIEASIFMAEPSMACALDAYQRAHVYAPDDAVNDLPRLGTDLLFARVPHRPPSPDFLAQLESLLKRIGIASSRPERTVGSWTLEPLPYDEGPTWQDFHATRDDIAGNPHRRIRIYLESHLGDEDARRSVRGAALREFKAAEGVHHAGILTPADLEEHELGPALVIEQGRHAERLDHWLVRHRDRLTLAERVGLVAQLATAVAYAHRKGLVHRALSPRAVIVESGVLRVGEWQVATRDMASSHSPRRMAPTSLSAGHLDPTVEPYLPPDFVTEGVDGTVDVDIFGVGAIAHLVLADEPPAASRAELNDRLTRDRCLDPRTAVEALDTIVREATRPLPRDRTPEVDDILQALQAYRRPSAPTKDPLDAVAGDVLPGGYRVEQVLGTGTTARAFLVRRDGMLGVLKVGRHAEAERHLLAEAAALEDLRHDHIVVLRRASFAIGERRAIELSHAGPRTLADVVATDGPLRGDDLRLAGDQLLAAVEYLAGRGVHHRDLKPANVGVRGEPSELAVTLFDFSLSTARSDDLESGSSGYLDPHLGRGGRTSFDSAAELYALAVTLHETASGAVPRWGDDRTPAAFVDAATVAEEAFDPAVRGALTTFFRRALDRETERRFATAGEMRAAWASVFATPPPTVGRPTVHAVDVHVDVVSALRRLGAEVQSSTLDALDAACRPPRLEAPPAARDDRMRLLPVHHELTGVVLLPGDGERALLLRLDAPEAAAAWARTHTASVNGVSGELELRDAVALDRLADVLATATGAVDLFGHVTDDDLAGLGVDERVAAYARTVPSVAQLESVQLILPAAQFGVLLALARGQSVEEVRRGLGRPMPTDGPVDPGDLGAAVRRSEGQIAILEELAGLRELLEKPISRFRIFLPHAQRRLAYSSNWGSAQVTGGPGTGKTVVALHRVKHLVERRDLEPGSVLLTTFTRGLADALGRDLGQMIDAGRMEAVEVVNIDRWAHHLLGERLGTRLSLLGDDDAEERWRRAAADAGTDRSPAFLAAEWEQVVLAQRITDEQAYLTCERRGRGRALPPAQRAPVWRAIHAFEQGLRADGRWTHPLIADEAARLLAHEEPPYEHVVVDEIQDLHPAHWRLVRAAVKRKPEDLFLTGDPHQRIYGHRVSLKSVGIDIGGRRSSKLTLSYRTSAEILQWALRMLGDHHETGLDDVADDLVAYRSAFSGAAPEVVGADTREDEMADLVEAVRLWHDDGIDWEDIAVVARSRWVWGGAASALRQAGVPVIELRKAVGESAVRIGTMHGLKGLEFRAVAVVGVRDGVVPRKGITPASEDEVVHRNELQDERNLLFVAATRPRERLRVSWHGEPSPFLPDVGA